MATHKVTTVSDEPTIQSVAEALWHQHQERMKVEEVTGWRFVGDELVPQKLAFIACTVPGCLVTVCGGSNDEAFCKLEDHLQRRHGIQAPEQVA